MTPNPRVLLPALLVVLLSLCSWTPAPLAAAGADPQSASVKTPVRIISVVPAVTEMLFALGAGREVVGVSSYDHYPPEVESRPKVGALIDPDFERILSLKPDLVVVYGSQADLIARLARVGVPIFDYSHAGLADITETIDRLGARIGRVDAARREVTRIRTELDEVRRLVAGRRRPRTALLFGRELGSLRSMFASGGVGFMHDMLDIAGAIDVFDDAKRQSLQVSTETMIARAPEVILEVHPSAGWTPARIESERALWRALPSLPAVRAGRVHILADDLLLVPGPRVTIAVRMMARALHPDLQRMVNGEW